MTYGMTLDPVRAADQYEESLSRQYEEALSRQYEEALSRQYEEALSQAAADCREHEEKFAEARATLSEIYGKAMKGPADFPIPTPGSSRKTRAVFELLGDLEDDQLVEVFEILRDAASGNDVRGRATIFLVSVAERHADWYAEVSVIGYE